MTPEMLPSFEMQSQAGVYLSVRNALVQAVVDCSPCHLGVPRNFPVGIKCIHAIYGATQAPEIIEYYRCDQKTLETVLSITRGAQIGTVGAAEPPHSPLPWEQNGTTRSRDA